MIINQTVTAIPDYPLASASLYNVGGPAKLALLPKNRVEVETAYQWIKEQSEPIIVLGGGSNVLIADEGFPYPSLIETYSIPLSRFVIVKVDRPAQVWSVGLEAVQSQLFSWIF